MKNYTTQNLLFILALLVIFFPTPTSADELTLHDVPHKVIVESPPVKVGEGIYSVKVRVILDDDHHPSILLLTGASDLKVGQEVKLKCIQISTSWGKNTVLFAVPTIE